MNRPIGLLLACLVLSGCASVSRAYKVLADPTLTIGGPNREISHLALSLYAADLPTSAAPKQVIADAQTALQGPYVQLTASLTATDPEGLNNKLGALADLLQQNYPASIEDEHALNDSRVPAALASYATTPSDLPQSTIQAPQRQTPSSIAFKVLQLRDDSLLLDATYEQVEEDLDSALGTTLISVDDYRLMPGHFKFIEHEEINERTRYIAVIARLGDDRQGNWKDAVRIQPRGYNHTVHVHFENNGVELRHDSELRRAP
ncbi:type VI secretion system lipoprotein TssJ [Pseudomonas sp. NPDC090233]|uniref:type VI secretion system lipoprotein TssJ n=1 Tax=Pseudomonas sp. NPDC090233 TaxID=3364479 RepID=UPI00383B2E6F